jgi:hypothetical protein
MHARQQIGKVGETRAVSYADDRYPSEAAGFS